MARKALGMEERVGRDDLFFINLDIVLLVTLSSHYFYNLNLKKINKENEKLI